jgi:phage-related protein
MIMDQLEFIEDAPSNTLIVAFACQPYRYLYPALASLTYTTSPGTITNTGTASAEPVITVTGSGDIALTIGSRIINIAALASSITIDCAAGMATNGSTDLTSTVTFDAFPFTVMPGESAVSWTGSVTSVVITRPWRYI